MKAREIYSGTMKFVWLKLAISAVGVLATGLTGGLFALIGSIFSQYAATLFGIFGLAIGIGIWFAIGHYFGYMVKAGHVAVVAHALSTGALPQNQTEWAKEAVKSRFATANVYYVVDSLVNGAVSQLRKAVNLAAELLKFVPGISFAQSFADQLVSTVLGNVDECCLGWCFLHREMGSFHASCDGVSIFFQNSKQLLKSGAKHSLAVTAVSAAAFTLVGLICVLLFHKSAVACIIALVIGFSLIYACKAAFLNSYTMIKMMAAYMQLAPNTVLNYDLYAKLCGLSSKFKKLYEQAREEMNKATETVVQE